MRKPKKKQPKPAMSAVDRARWAEIQREHMRRLGFHPPAEGDPSPLVDPETFALWHASRTDLPSGPKPKELDVRKVINAQLRSLE